MEVRESYRWDESSLARMAAAGVDWRQASYIMNEARPQIRQHLGAVLRIAALDRHDRWLAVTLVEEGDDAYLVVAARYLDSDEQDSARKMIEGGGR